LALSGGGDRTHLRYLRPDGNIQTETGEHVTGNHKGQFASLNFVGLRPGHVVQYANARNPSSINGCKVRGWWIADPERDGRPAYMLSHGKGDFATAVDSVTHNQFPDLVPMVTTIENFRRLQEERAQANREAISDGGTGFLEGAPPDEIATGRTNRGIHPTRFALPSHTTTIQEGDNIIEQITPHGVLREE